MSAKELRQQINTNLDLLPYNKILIISQLLSAMTDDDEEFYIDTNLSEEDHAAVEESKKEYKEHPENFISLQDYLKERYAQ
ncbi:MAG: hypothetical protein LBM59_00475 [Ruminococcus sp.]|jgi:hypothetical protein|nr:hypothetical protein [Ruminococcus sp.]